MNNNMSPKERMLAAIKGEVVDRVPWSPFLAYFWEAQPEEVQRRGKLDFLEEVGADPLLRAFYEKDTSLKFFKLDRKNCERKYEDKGNRKYIIYDTPVGQLIEGYKYSPGGDTWFLVEHPVRDEEDFKILTYINENTSVIPDKEALDKFIKVYKETGDRALYLPIIGSGTTDGAFKSSFQAMLEHWVGTEQLVYAVMDYPETVEECLNAMKKNSVKSAKISVDSPAEAFLFFEDTSTTNISPGYFKKYIAPEIDEWGDILHENGKYLVHHACGHLKDLLPLMNNTKIDMIESISPPPTGNIELWDAKEYLNDGKGLIGGIEPTVFLNSSLEELEKYVKDLLIKMGKTNFVLANSDSCPPGVTVEKFKLVTDIVNSFTY